MGGVIKFVDYSSLVCVFTNVDSFSLVKSHAYSLPSKNIPCHFVWCFYSFIFSYLFHFQLYVLVTSKTFYYKVAFFCQQHRQPASLAGDTLTLQNLKEQESFMWVSTIPHLRVEPAKKLHMPLELRLEEAPHYVARISLQLFTIP